MDPRLQPAGMTVGRGIFAAPAWFCAGHRSFAKPALSAVEGAQDNNLSQDVVNVCQNGCIQNGKTRGDGPLDFLECAPL